MKNWFLHIAFTTICFFSAHSQSVFTNLDYANTCDKFTKFEISFELPEYSNNYDPDVIDVYASFISPTGVSHKVNAFFYEGFNKLDDGIYNSCEELEQNSEKKWMIRFTPDEPGLWSFKLNRRENNEPLAYQYPDNEFLQFVCTDSDFPGFVKLRDSKYMERSNGDGFIPVGNSLPWFERTPWRGTCTFGTNEMVYLMDLMSENNMNFFRFEINYFEGIGIIGYDYTLQKNFCRYYNQKAGWRLDNILQYAEQKDIFILFALFAHVQLGNDGVITQYHSPEGNVSNYDFFDSNNQFIDGHCHGAWSLYHPYNEFLSINNLPTSPDSKLSLKSPYEFHSDSLARSEQKKLIRYIIARWGYSHHLFGYELMDEADRIDYSNRNDAHPNHVQAPSGLNQSIIDWHVDLVDFIRTHNTHKQLITTAYADMNHPTAKEVYKLMDFTQIHNYANYIGAPWENIQDSYKAYIDEYLSLFNKPTMIGEHNYIDYGEINTLDPNLYNLKDNLWATLHNGSFGPASYWKMSNIMEQNAIGLYKGIGVYARTLDVFSEQFESFSRSEKDFRCFYMKLTDSKKIFGWCQDNKMTFRSLLTQNPSYLESLQLSDKPLISNEPISIEFETNKDGKYEVRWYCTNSGDLISTQSALSISNQILVQMPNSLRNSKHGDAAFQIEFISDNIEFNSTIFPNPSNSGLFTVSVNDNISINGYNVFSLKGTLIASKTVGVDSQLVIDLSQFASGIYLVEVVFGGTTKRQFKLVKS